MNWGLYGYLTLLAFVAELVFGVGAFVFVKRLLSRPPTAAGEEIRGVSKVLDKVRKGEPMSKDELDLATQTIADRRSWLAFCIPAAIFTIGCFYVFGSFDQLHGRDPSFRTYIGLLPMLGAINIAVQLLKAGHLKRHLPDVSLTEPTTCDA